jgi:RHS repeat-associated protein
VQTETNYIEDIQFSVGYDQLGRIVSRTDPENYTTKYEYDDLNQLTAIVDPRSGRTEYQYGENGELESVKDALNQTTTYQYNDPQGRITSITLPDPAKRSTIDYDDTENTITVTDFNGKAIQYNYNQQGRLLSKAFEDGTSVSYAYDETERRETISSSRGESIYQYDEFGRLLSRKDPSGPYIGGDGASITYDYNDNSQLILVRTPHQEIGYDYYDDGQLKSVTTPEGTTTYHYQDNQLYKTVFPNNTAEIIQYDVLGQIDIIKTVQIDPETGVELSVITSFDYEIDAVGNRLSVLDQDGRLVEYDYDELHRVTEEKITDLSDPSNDGRIITYTYDAVGNRLLKTDSVEGNTNYRYNSLNQLTTSIHNGIATLYTYDDNGNLKTRSTDDYLATYEWQNDGENRLIGIIINNGVETTNIEYLYNENGIRTGKIVDGVKTHYLVDELRPYAQVLEEYDSAGVLQTRYAYGLDLISHTNDGESFFYQVDGLRSTRALTDELGQVVATYTYDAYGNALLDAASGENAYQFAGEQRDPETGLDYLRARYYDPTLGRFISADAFSGSIDDPISLHDYIYAHNNPVLNTDPSGYQTNLQGFLAGFTAGAVLSSLTYISAVNVIDLATGGSLSDSVARYDQYFAGFADVLTFGASTAFRRWKYGETATNNHEGLFFTLGRLGGTAANFWIGSHSASLREFSTASWWARGALGLDVVGLGVGLGQSTVNLLEDEATVWDAFTFATALFWYTSFRAAPGPSPGGSLEPGNPRSTDIPRNTDRLVVNQGDIPVVGQYACGPTSCAMVLDTAGLNYDLDTLIVDTRLAENIQNPRLVNGTYDRDLAAVLVDNGLTQARVKRFQSIEALRSATAQGDPAITLMRLDRGPHFVVVDGITTRTYYTSAGIPGIPSRLQQIPRYAEVVAIRDPAGGLPYFTPVSEFSPRWSGIGIFTNSP